MRPQCYVLFERITEASGCKAVKSSSASGRSTPSTSCPGARRWSCGAGSPEVPRVADSHLCVEPGAALVGAASIEGVRRMTPAGLWRSFRDRACVERSLFDDYFGAPRGLWRAAGGMRALRGPIPVSELRERFRFFPPQSYRYIRGPLTGLWNDERIQVPDRHEHRDRSGGRPSGRGRTH